MIEDILRDPDLRTVFFAILLGFFASLVLGILVHETGHAIVGSLGGFRIRLIRIGRGPVLFRMPVGLGLLVWHLFPISGAVAIYRPLLTKRRSLLMLIAGGSLANALVAVVLAALLPWPPDPLAHPVLTPVFLVQAFGILNLLVVIGPGRKGTTDGGRFRATLRQPALTTDRMLAGLYEKYVGDRMGDLPAEPPSALSAVVLHALVVGTPEATYTQLGASGTAPRQGDRLRAKLLAQHGLTQRERAALLGA